MLKDLLEKFGIEIEPDVEIEKSEVLESALEVVEDYWNDCTEELQNALRIVIKNGLREA